MPALRKLEGPDLDELLALVRQECGVEARIVEAHRVRRGGIGGFFAREAFEVVVEEPDAPRPPASFLGLVEEAASADGPAEPPPTPTASSTNHLLPPPPAVLPADDPRPPPPSGPVTVASAGPPPAPRRGPAMPSTAPSSAPLSALVAELTGARPTVLPFLPSVSVPAPTLAELLDRFDLAPAPPPLPTAGIVAVLGEVGMARRVAEALAPGAGLGAVITPRPPSGVPTWLVLPGAEAAAVRAPRWHRRPAPVLVVVELGADTGDRAWAAGVLDALAPAQVRLVAHAARDLRPVLDRSLRADALDLVGLDDVIDPEVLLGLGVPVATLDGRPASAALWAAATLERWVNRG